jgi:Predicted transcriptional regulators
MSQWITLRELCLQSGISRRTIQGYEKAGLVKASGKNKYGHLLYDEEAQKRIVQIRLYQQLGFPVKQIESVLHQPSEVRKKQMEGRIEVLKEERKEIGRLIQEAEKVIAKIENGEMK